MRRNLKEARQKAGMTQRVDPKHSELCLNFGQKCFL